MKNCDGFAILSHSSGSYSILQHDCNDTGIFYRVVPYKAMWVFPTPCYCLSLPFPFCPYPLPNPHPSKSLFLHQQLSVIHHTWCWMAWLCNLSSTFFWYWYCLLYGQNKRKSGEVCNVLWCMSPKHCYFCTKDIDSLDLTPFLIPFTKVMHLIERKKLLDGLAKYWKLREL